MLVELLHHIASGTAVFARVELTGFLGEYLTNGSREGETRVGVDINLAHSRLGSLAQLFLGDTYCIGQFAAVGVDYIHILLGNG